MVENMPKVPTQRKYLIERVLSSSYIGHRPSFAWQFDNSCTVNSNNLLLRLCQDAYNCISASRRSFLAFKQIVQQSVEIRSPCLSALQIIRQFSMQQYWHFEYQCFTCMTWNMLLLSGVCRSSALKKRKIYHQYYIKSVLSDRTADGTH